MNPPNWIRSWFLRQDNFTLWCIFIVWVITIVSAVTGIITLLLKGAVA